MGQRGYRYKRGTFFQMAHVVIDEWAPVLGTIGLAVYMLLARRYNPATGSTIYESQQKMADRLDIARNTLTAHLVKLERLGLVHRVQVPGHKRKHQQYAYEPILPAPSPGNSSTIEPTLAQTRIRNVNNRNELQTIENSKKQEHSSAPLPGGFEEKLEQQLARDKASAVNE